MSRLFRGYKVTVTLLGIALDCSAPTARKKLNNPKFFTLDDLYVIHRVFGIPWEEIRGALTR